MSINWNWKDKIGELKVKQKSEIETLEFNVSIYEGNADLIFIYEFVEEGKEMYNLYNFYCDLQHLKRCVADEHCSFEDWKELIFFKCDAKRCNFAKEFFKLGIKISFEQNTKEE